MHVSQTMSMRTNIKMRRRQVLSDVTQRAAVSPVLP